MKRILQSDVCIAVRADLIAAEPGALAASPAFRPLQHHPIAHGVRERPGHVHPRRVPSRHVAHPSLASILEVPFFATPRRRRARTRASFDHLRGAFPLFLTNSPKASLASFCDRMLLSPRRTCSTGGNPCFQTRVRPSSAYDPTSCFSRVAQLHRRLHRANLRDGDRARRGGARDRASRERSASSASHAATNASMRAKRFSASSYSELSCGNVDKATGVAPHRAPLTVAVRFEFANSARVNVSAACATATRPVKSRWPIISIGFFAAPRYAPVAASTPPCRFKQTRGWGTRTSLELDPRVVQVVTGGLAPHVTHRDPRREASVSRDSSLRIDEKRVRARGAARPTVRFATRRPPPSPRTNPARSSSWRSPRWGS